MFVCIWYIYTLYPEYLCGWDVYVGVCVWNRDEISSLLAVGPCC